MNKVRNWTIVSAIGFIAALAAVGTPYMALGLAAAAACAAYAALVRYEDHRAYLGCK
jgi:hypothetical protein